MAKSALSQVKKIPDNIYLRIRDGLLMLKDNPRPIGCKKLTNEEGYRIRIGSYRVLYTIDDINLEIQIHKDCS
ncbi:MAG: type II toxin-antitoxin system RelE/ParE family toxin [Bacteroidota bacterium]|nr:type II toxin-antitoxin system RelE/ParE family toxin [Bacteroidota bacterium]